MRVHLAGYIHHWHDEPADNRGFTFAPGAFSEWLDPEARTGHGLRLLWSHTERLPLAYRSRSELGVWDDGYGLAFEALIPSARMPLVDCDIASGSMGCSSAVRIHDSYTGFLSGRPSTHGPIGRVVTKAALLECTLTPAPCFPTARVWFADVDSRWDLAPHVREQRDRWIEGKRAPRRRPSVGRVTAAKSAPPSTLYARPLAPVTANPSAWAAHYTPQALRDCSDPVRRAVRRHIAAYMARAPL